MPEPRQLAFLENLAAEKSEVQAVQLARARQALKAAETQLAQLQQYEESYNAQLGNRLEAAIAVDALRGHHRFMQNVAHAVRQQEIEVARRRAYADAIERVWQETERRRQGFRVLNDHASAQLRRAESRQQQKANDEFAARNLLNSNVGF